MPTCDRVSLRVAEVLDRRRRLLDLSQAALATRLGVHRANLSRRLDGRTMTTATIDRMAEALECELVIQVRPKAG